MKLIGITPRVEVIKAYKERRDALDQRWFELLYQCGYLTIVLPTTPKLLANYLTNIPLHGIILSGGNSLVNYGGDAPERDETDTWLIDYADKHQLPLLGVCRGMQSILHHFGNEHQTITGHVTPAMNIDYHGNTRVVNSYHNLGCYQVNSPLAIDATAEDGVLKAIHHQHSPIYGIMWHPERNTPFEQQDIALIKKVFK